MDSAFFLEMLAGNFMDTVQYNEDNRGFEVRGGGGGGAGTEISVSYPNAGLSSVSVLSHTLPPHIVFLTLKKTLGSLMLLMEMSRLPVFKT